MFFGPCDEIPRARRRRVRGRMPARVQRLVGRLLRARTDAVVRRRGRAAPGVALACQEVEHAAERGFARPCSSGRPRTSTSSRSNHHVYDDFWSTCEGTRHARRVSIPRSPRRQLPARAASSGLVAVSEIRRSPTWRWTRIHGGSALGQAVGNPVDMIVTMGRVLMGGVCERFARLKLCSSNRAAAGSRPCSNGWTNRSRRSRSNGRWLSLLPSEYFARQCT